MRREDAVLGPRHVGLALLVAAIWGFNFVVIKVGVTGMPPLLLAALRFVLSVFPAILFVRKPRVGWGLLAAYGLFLGVGEFGLLFTAIRLGAPAGLSSILLQSQAFFTALLAVALLGEPLRGRTLAGLALAALGLALLALPQSGAGLSLPLGPALMIVLAALFWAAANIVARRMPGADALGLMVWSSLFSPLPLFALALVFDGPATTLQALLGMSLLSLGALAYLAFLSTLVGYGIWNGLIISHGASRIAPFSLLVPIFSLSSASIFLGEAFAFREGLAAALVLGGICIHLLWPSKRAKAG